MSPQKPKNASKILNPNNIQARNAISPLVPDTTKILPDLNICDCDTKPLHVNNLGMKISDKIVDSLPLNKQQISKKRKRQQYEEKSVEVFDTAMDIAVADTGKSGEGNWDFKG